MENAVAKPELHMVDQATAGPEVAPADLPRPPRTWVIYDEAGGGVEVLVGDWLRVSVQHFPSLPPRPPLPAGTCTFEAQAVMNGTDEVRVGTLEAPLTVS